MSNKIEDYYDNYCQVEDLRLSEYSLEYLMTSYLINKYAPAAKTVCDIGGATGTYAIPLAYSGKKVCLFDISQKEIDLAKQKATLCGVDLQTKKCDVFTDDIFLGQTYDLVLCLGPLYHCRNEKDVLKVMSTLNLLMHKKSVAILSFLTKYAKLNTAAQKTRINREEMLSMIDYYNFISHFFSSTFVFRDKVEIPISYVSPVSIGSYLSKQGFRVRDVVAADLYERCDTKAEKEDIAKFTEMAYQLGRSAMLNGGNHIIAVITK